MTSIKARLNRSHLGSDDKYPLVIQVIRNRKKSEMYTPYRLTTSEFDVGREKVLTKSRSKKRIFEIQEINEYLIYIKEEFRLIEDALSEQGDDYTAADVVRGFEMRNDMSRFFAYAADAINKLDSQGKHGTASNYRSAVNAFDRYVVNRELSLADITRKTVEGFMEYQLRQGNNPNTVLFYVKQIRAIYNKAVYDGLVPSPAQPFENVRLKGHATPKRAISDKEINRIIHLHPSGKHKHLEWAHDLFLFSLYTRGMSFVDMCYLTKENVKGNMLVYQRRKTKQWLQVRIEAPLRALLNKYADEDSFYLLPMLRDDDSYKGYRYVQRRLNKRIREIGNMLEFDFPLTFYVARHTWATLAHKKGIPVSVISEGMGHTSEHTTRIYLAGLDHQVIDKANRKIINSWK